MPVVSEFTSVEYVFLLFGLVLLAGWMVSGFADVYDAVRKYSVSTTEVVVLEHPDGKREILRAGSVFRLLGGYKLVGSVSTGLKRRWFVSRVYCGAATLRVQEDWTYEVRDFEEFLACGGRDAVEREVQSAMHKEVSGQVKGREGFLLNPALAKEAVEAAVREAGHQCGVEVISYTVDLLSYEKRL